MTALPSGLYPRLGVKILREMTENARPTKASATGVGGRGMVRIMCKRSVLSWKSSNRNTMLIAAS